jgi:hypothetical protein
MYIPLSPQCAVRNVFVHQNSTVLASSAKTSQRWQTTLHYCHRGSFRLSMRNSRGYTVPRTPSTRTVIQYLLVQYSAQHRYSSTIVQLKSSKQRQIAISTRSRFRIACLISSVFRIPTYFSGCRLETEGDVVFNSTLYSILSCLEVIEHFYPEKWKVRVERSVVLNMPLHDFDFSKLPKGKKPPTEKSTVRYDLIFETVPLEGQQVETLAILEYKGAGLIRYVDYSSAILNADEAEAEVQRQR